MQSQVFDDFDAFAESVRDVDSKMFLRNPQRRVWSTCAVDLGGIDLQIGRLGSGNIAMGELRSDGYMLYLPLTNSVEYSANGDVLPKQSFAVLEPGCEFCISTKLEHDWCVAFIPTDSLSPDGELAQPTSPSCRVTRPNQRAVDAFRTMLLQIVDTAAGSAEFESSPAARRAAEDVLRLATSVIAPSPLVEHHLEGRPKISRREIIHSSMELLEQEDGTLMSVHDLATANRVSERTLRAAFKEYFGLGPVRYFQLLRLHRIHRALKAAAPEKVTVSQILLEHGEWAFGRFAARYRQLFGELPSDTLRTKASSWL